MNRNEDETLHIIVAVFVLLLVTVCGVELLATYWFQIQ
jgi:hypothetical protein